MFKNTQSVFLSDTTKFDTASNYLKECAVINVAIYTTQIECYEEIAKQLLDVMNDCTVSAVVYCVEVENFTNITEYKSTAKVLKSGSFWIENNEIKSLEEEGNIVKGSIAYDEDNKIFSFQYSDGSLGGISLQEFGGNYNGKASNTSESTSVSSE